ncbi:cadherin-related family member 4 [Tenrec ecaudatus]|uniref:cadherin-related family member 4 n=1 Tax=Tenrec ecaudatus TaxID=94439 RepID=UPI003F592EE7
MALLRSLVLLFMLGVPDLQGLPWSLNISESLGPGTVLESFSFNCSSFMPVLELLSVKPPTTFFNPPSLTRWQSTYYVGKVTLSSSVRLDALAVNHYELQLRFTCGTHVTEAPLFLDVQRDLSRVQCAGLFASPAEEIIQVRESVTPGAHLYTLLLPGLELQGPQMSIISAQDPPRFPGSFTINNQGWLQAPSQGLKGQAGKDFPLRISVTFGQGRNCQGMLMVKVLPVPSSQVSFLEQLQNITIPETQGPGSEVARVRARGFHVRYEIISPVPCPRFSIGYADGAIRLTTPLELAQDPGAAVTRLQVKAFEQQRPWASAELDLSISVQAVNRWPPHCVPALLLTQIPETAPVGSVLDTFTCTDPDSPSAALHYHLWIHSSRDPTSLCLQDRVLEVNTTLDCDTPGPCFQLSASMIVLDDGQPPMTTEIPVLVTVTPVNEFSPTCAPSILRVRENARPHTLLGSVVGTDMDYPQGNIEYDASGGPAVFTVDRRNGEVRLLGPLDYERQRLYRLTVQVLDHDQDQDPTNHHTGSCTITIEVEDVNDHEPKCEPPFQELTIHAFHGRSVEVTKVSCWIPQEPQRLAFSYNIVGGNSQSRFSLQGAVLVHNGVVSGSPWSPQSRTYELLIRVADAGPTPPHLSTTATIIVHLVPWRVSTVAPSTRRAPMTSMNPLLVTSTEAFWQPEAWFVVVLTVTGTLLLLALGWLLSRLLRGAAHRFRTPKKPAQGLLPNSVQRTEGPTEGLMESPRIEMPQGPNSITSLAFDGRAQDPCTGRDYLFNTRTGAWYWL